ncbi:MAG: hypothetical protein IIC67_04485 [Thaumarchaeota archaeon]|nr:hypothetical protein [Nitrososphaerota archaeon]
MIGTCHKCHNSGIEVLKTTVLISEIGSTDIPLCTSAETTNLVGLDICLNIIGKKNNVSTNRSRSTINYATIL